jgi:hypothetical protein
MTNSFIGPDDNEYSLTHLAPFEIIFKLKIKNQILDIPIWISFRDHCYTREVTQGDDLKWLIGGTTRIFCRDRWTYSHGVPNLLRSFISDSQGSCYRTTQRGLYFKLEKSSHRVSNPTEGWYLFFKFSKGNKKLGQLSLSVESVHDRTSLPANARGNHSLRFWSALKDFLKTRPDLLREIQENQHSQNKTAPK